MWDLKTYLATIPVPKESSKRIAMEIFKNCILTLRPNNELRIN